MRFAPFALAASVLVVSACAASGVSTVGQVSPWFRTSDNARALNDRDVFVIVQGGGYGVDQAAFRQAVLDGMHHYRSGMNTRFTATPTTDYNSDYKVVMLFNGPITAQAGQLCSRPEQFGAITPMINGETHVLAAFCQYDSPLTEVSGRAVGVTSLNDPRFRSLLQQTMTDLFPTSDERPDRDSDSGGGGDIP